MGILKIILRTLIILGVSFLIIKSCIIYVNQALLTGKVMGMEFTYTFLDVYLIIGFITLFLIAAMVLALLIMIISWTFSND